MGRLIAFGAVVYLAAAGAASGVIAQEERYYTCTFNDATEASRDRPNGEWEWRHSLVLAEQVTVALYGDEGSLSFKNFELPAKIIAGDTYDPFVNELVIHGQDSFTALLTVQNTSVTLVLSDRRNGISAAFSYISQSNKTENLTLATGSCDMLR